MKLTRYPRAVLWSFFGIRRRANMQADLEELSPLALIATGIAAAALFVVILMAIASFAASRLG